MTKASLKSFTLYTTAMLMLYGNPLFINESSAENVAQSICEYVAADDKNRLRSFLKTNKLKIRNIFNQIQCNNMNLLEFAADRNSINTGNLIISKLPKSTISESLSKLSSNAELLDAANKRLE
jgi:hypothetical protein